MVDDFSNFLDHICLCYVGCGVLHWNTRLAVGVGGWFDLISPLFLFRFVTIVFSQYIYADHLHCIFHYRLYNFLLCRLGQTKVLFILNCINFFEVSKKTKKKKKIKRKKGSFLIHIRWSICYQSCQYLLCYFYLNLLLRWNSLELFVSWQRFNFWFLIFFLKKPAQSCRVILKYFFIFLYTTILTGCDWWQTQVLFVHCVLFELIERCRLRRSGWCDKCQWLCLVYRGT